MTILTRSKVDEGGGKSTLRRDKKVSREADLYHSCVVSFPAVPWSFYFFRDNENTNLSIQSTDSTFN
jgi:hypothetical protein